MLYLDLERQVLNSNKTGFKNIIVLAGKVDLLVPG